jgi:hypothetical protein
MMGRFFLEANGAAPLFLGWLVVDSRVVDVSMVSNPTFVFLSSLEPLFFSIALKMSSASRTTWEHKTPESNMSATG